MTTTREPSGARRQAGSLEQEVMAVLWASDQALTPGEVQQGLGADLAYTTVMTILTRLHGKGLWATVEKVDAVYSANTFHIMSWSSLHDLFKGVGSILVTGGLLCVYGPFRYGDRYTSESNAKFDAFLRNRDPESGLRDAHEVDRLAREQGLALIADHAMPANNQLRIWQRGQLAA